MADQGTPSTTLNTSEVLGECRKTLFNDDGDIFIMVKTMVSKITAMEEKINVIEEQTRTLTEVNEKLTALTVRVEKSEESIKVMKNQVRELEGDLQGQSNLYDGLKEKSDQVDRELKK